MGDCISPAVSTIFMIVGIQHCLGMFGMYFNSANDIAHTDALIQLDSSVRIVWCIYPLKVFTSRPDFF